MQKIIEMHDKNAKVTEGETITFNGEEIEIPGMTQEEINQMIEDGKKIGDIEITKTIDDEDVEMKLIDIKNGREVYKILNALEVEENLQAFWYVWREQKIEKRLETLSEGKRNKIKKLLGR